MTAMLGPKELGLQRRIAACADPRVTFTPHQSPPEVPLTNTNKSLERRCALL